jgi:hypothetical protein
VTGSVFILGGNLEVEGEIEGDLAVIGGNANLDQQAIVRGDVWTLGGNVNPDGATIGGELTSGEAVDIPFDFENFEFQFDRALRFPSALFPISIEARVLTYLFQSFVLAGLAVLLVMLWPAATERVVGAMVERPITAGGLGLLTAVLSLPTFLILVITICFIPVAMLLVLLLIIAGIFGWISLGLEVGRRLARALDQQIQPVLAAGIGTLVLSLVAFGIGFVPCVGWLASFLVGCLGLGSVILTRFGSQVYPPLMENLPEISELP